MTRQRSQPLLSWLRNLYILKKQPNTEVAFKKQGELNTYVTTKLIISEGIIRNDDPQICAKVKKIKSKLYCRYAN